MAGRFNLSDYVDTQTRITEFWTKCSDEGDIGFIHTEVLTDPNVDMFIVVRASVGYWVDGEQRIMATGIASEVRSYPNDGTKHFVNETSWVENCETSAIGRAFANFGYATTGADRPSREEMAKVQRYEDAAQNQRQAVPPEQARPAQRPSAGGSGGYNRPKQSGPIQVANPNAEPTERQIKMILEMAKGNEDNLSMAMFEKMFADLTRGEASDMIGELMDARNRCLLYTS